MPDDISLYRLESGLIQLLEYRQERLSSTEDPASEEELVALDGEIKAYVTEKLPVKIDSTAAVVLWKERRLASLREEKERIKRAINAESSDLERLKAYIADVLALLPEPKKGSRKLSGATHTLSLRGNGGLAPMEISDETMVPNQYRDATVTMPYEDWSKIEGFCPNAAKVTVSLNNARIRDDLESGEGVPGASLLPRGSSLKVT